MVMMVSDGTRPYVWTCPWCGWTKASATSGQHQDEQRAHRRTCPGGPGVWR